MGSIVFVGQIRANCGWPKGVQWECWYKKRIRFGSVSKRLECLFDRLTLAELTTNRSSVITGGSETFVVHPYRPTEDEESCGVVINISDLCSYGNWGDEIVVQ